jgi:CTP:molybdopterin cytidylyltransferase MocA
MKSLSPRELRVVILASGFSTRLGAPKALARIHGRTLLERLSRTLAPLSRRPVAIVVPPRSATRRAALRLGLICLDNPHRGRGLSSAVRLALRHAAQSSGVLLLPVDLTELRRESLARMLSRWRGQRRKVVARRLGSRGVIPLILPRHLFHAANTMHGDSGLRDWMSTLKSDQVVLIDVHGAESDIDTPSDLTRARRRFNR